MTGDARAAARGGASLLVLQSLGRLAGLAFVLVVTRHLGPEEFGRYSTVAALVVFATFLADFGTSSAITRLVSRSPGEADALLAGTVAASFGLGVLGYAAVVAFAAVGYGGPTAADAAVGALGVPFASALSSLLGALDGVGLIARRAAVTAVQTAVVAAGALPVLLGTGVRGALVLLAAAPAVSLLLAAGVTRRAGVWRSRPGLEAGRCLALVRAALPYAATGAFSALAMRFGVVLLSLSRSPAETARYDLALRLLESVAYLSAALTGPLLFILSRRLGAGDRDGARRAFTEAVRVLYLLGLPLSVGLALLARPVVAVALGPAYGGATAPFAVMAGAQWLTWLVYVQGSLLMAGDFMRRGVAVGGAIAAATVGLGLVLVPLAGAVGAGLAMVAAWTFSVVVLHRFHRRTVGIATPLPSIRVVASAAAMGVVVAGLRHQPLPVPVVAGALTYAAAVLATGAVTAADRRWARALLSRRGSAVDVDVEAPAATPASAARRPARPAGGASPARSG